MALVGGDDIGSAGVFRGVEFQAEEIEAVADGGADFGGVFADAAGEDDGVEAAERRCERAEMFRAWWPNS